MKPALSATAPANNIPVALPTTPAPFSGVSDGRYTARLAQNAFETSSALRLRHEVFNIEMGNLSPAADTVGLEFDSYDFRSRHMIVVDDRTGETVGTYRLNAIESARSPEGFYSYSEFTIEDLPGEVLENGIEIGRACVAPEHRNTKVLFLLLKALLHYQRDAGKRYFFGCCSIFTRDTAVAVQAYRQLAEADHFHDVLRVQPRKKCADIENSSVPDGGSVELPGLFKLYLRTGAKACGPPTIDREFGTIDFFVIFDVVKISEKYRKLFFV
jgi:putative hemolysin